MQKLSDLNFEEKVNEMLEDFQGILDTDSICNIKDGSKIIQVQITLVDSEESDFNDYPGIPTIIV